MKNSGFQFAVLAAIGLALGVFCYEISKRVEVPHFVLLLGVAVWTYFIGAYILRSWSKAKDVPNKRQYTLWIAFESLCLLTVLGLLTYIVVPRF